MLIYPKGELNVFRSPDIHVLIIRANFKEKLTINRKCAANVRWGSNRCCFIIIRAQEFSFWHIHPIDSNEITEDFVSLRSKRKRGKSMIFANEPIEQKKPMKAIR